MIRWWDFWCYRPFSRPIGCRRRPLTMLTGEAYSMLRGQYGYDRRPPDGESQQPEVKLRARIRADAPGKGGIDATMGGESERGWRKADRIWSEPCRKKSRRVTSYAGQQNRVDQTRDREQSDSDNVRLRVGRLSFFISGGLPVATLLAVAPRCYWHRH